MMEQRSQPHLDTAGTVSHAVDEVFERFFAIGSFLRALGQFRKNHGQNTALDQDRETLADLPAEQHLEKLVANPFPGHALESGGSFLEGGKGQGLDLEPIDTAKAASPKRPQRIFTKPCRCVLDCSESPRREILPAPERVQQQSVGIGEGEGIDGEVTPLKIRPDALQPGPGARGDFNAPHPGMNLHRAVAETNGNHSWKEAHDFLGRGTRGQVPVLRRQPQEHIPERSSHKPNLKPASHKALHDLMQIIRDNVQCDPCRFQLFPQMPLDLSTRLNNNAGRDGCRHQKWAQRFRFLIRNDPCSRPP